jgi:transposase
MYIQQETLFSYEEILKFQPQTKLQIIVNELDLTRLIAELSKPSSRRGPKGHSIRGLILSLIAMAVEQIPYLTTLVERLKTDPVFRGTCGFDILSKTPSLATFSRFMEKLKNSESLIKEFEALILQANKLGMIGAESVAIDATDISSYEAATPKSEIDESLDAPDWGAKKGPDGKKKHWFGYKVHLVVDCKSGLPLEFLTTPASWNDGIEKIVHPLIDNFLERYKGIFKPKFWIMDKGYDNVHIYEHVVNKAEGFAIIPYNPRSEKAPPSGFDDKYRPICSMAYPLSFWGIDGDYLKYRCPHVVKDIDCPFGSNWCSKSNYGLCRKFNYKKEPRLYSYPPRATDKWYELYNLRNSVERCNHMLKNHFNLNNVRSRGAKKAHVFALISCIALAASSIAMHKIKIAKKSA